MSVPSVEQAWEFPVVWSCVVVLLLFEPSLDVGAPIPDVSADADPWRAISVAAPAVDRCEWDPEIGGELGRAEQRPR